LSQRERLLVGAVELLDDLAPRLHAESGLSHGLGDVLAGEA
jgi:hypothetical protein